MEHSHSQNQLVNKCTTKRYRRRKNHQLSTKNLIQSNEFATCHQTDLRDTVLETQRVYSHNVQHNRRCDLGPKKCGDTEWKGEPENHTGPGKWQENLLLRRLWMESLFLWEAKLQDKDVVRNYTSHKVGVADDSLSQQLSRKIGPNLWKPWGARKNQIQSHNVAILLQKETKQKHFNPHWS